ncbi:MAG: LON peptidase substrate-binding domain-containing protein [Bradymonadia bacterium]
MKEWKIDAEIYENIPMFPLKNAHLFPGAVLPLHIFEPRYIEMIEHVMDNGSNAIAIASSKPTSAESTGPVSVRTIMGAGVIFAAEKLEEGRWNILLRGISRISLTEEMPSSFQFRTIRAQVLHDVDVDIAHPLHTQLRSLLGQLAQNAPEAREGLNLIMSQGSAPGTLTNLLGAHATSDPYIRRQLLESTDVERRLRIATRYIGELLLERMDIPEKDTETFH